MENKEIDRYVIATKIEEEYCIILNEDFKIKLNNKFKEMIDSGYIHNMCVLVTGNKLTDEDFKLVYNNSNIEFNSKIYDYKNITATICFPKHLNIRNNQNHTAFIEYIYRPLIEFMRQAQEQVVNEYKNKMQEAIDKDRLYNYIYSTEQIIFNRIENINYPNQTLLIKNQIEHLAFQYGIDLMEVTFTEYNNKIILVFVLKYKPSQESAKNKQDILNSIKEIKL
jgi:hypothetical protein